MEAVLLISHGSRLAKTKEEVLVLLARLRQRVPERIYECAFLELETPSIPQGIDNCVTQGASRIIVLLNFLNSGRHVDHDIPAIIEQARHKHLGVQIQISTPIGQHSGIVDLFLDLIKQH